MKTPVYILIFMLLLTSCSLFRQHAAQCPNGKALKHKKYKLKKYNKRIEYPVYSASTRKKSPSNQQEEANERTPKSANSASASQLESEPPPANDLDTSVSVSPPSLSGQQTDSSNQPSEKQSSSPTPSAEPTTDNSTVEREVDEQSPSSAATIEDTTALVEEASRNYSSKEQPEEPEAQYGSTPNGKTLSQSNPTVSNEPINDSSSIAEVQDEISILRSTPTPVDTELTLSTEPSFDYDPQTELVFNGQVFKKEEDIRYKEKIRFIPNYDIVINEEETLNKLKKLAELLSEYPKKKVWLIGNGGWDVESKEDAPRYTTNPYTLQDIEILYGANPNVYRQTIYGLGIDEKKHPDWIARVEELGRNKVTQVRIGDLLRARTRRIKELLVEELGVNKKQVKTALGSFTEVNDHLVDIRID